MVKISELPIAGTLSGSEDVPVVQSGTTRRTTAQLLANLSAGSTVVIPPGPESFLDLTDTPNSYSGQALKSVRVNSGASGLEFATGASTPLPYVFLSDFGAGAGGDVTAQINACFRTLDATGGTVIWDVRGMCGVTDTIVVGDNSGTHFDSFISIIGPYSPTQCGIQWSGPHDGRPAMLLAKNKYFKIFGIQVTDPFGAGVPGARGTSVGIMLGGNGAPYGGTTCLGGVLENVIVSGFHLGISSGGNFGDASEILYQSCGIFSNDIGWESVGFNSLDHTFVSLSTGDNGVGLANGAGENFIVFGGSSSNNTYDFQLDNGRAVIIGWRSEGDDIFCSGGGHCALTAIGCELNNSQNGQPSIGGGYPSLTIQGCSLLAPVILSGVTSSLTMVGNFGIIVDPITGLPFTITSEAHSPIPTRVYCKGNLTIATLDPALDFDGILAPDVGVGSTSVIYEPNITKVPTGRDGTHGLGVDYLAFNHVRQLSEASMPGPIVGSGGNPIGVGTPGKNLRISAKFAGAADLSFTFKRTISINTGGFQQCNLFASAGAPFFQGDAGKPILIVGAGTAGNADWYGYVLDVDPGLAAMSVQPDTQQVCPGVFAPTNAVFGADEPDAKYMVVGITGNSSTPEYYSVSNIATTGFDIHSSNPTSTATITALIVR